MQSQFKHQHAKEYMEAYLVFSNVLMFKEPEMARSILAEAGEDVVRKATARSKQLERKDVNYSDTELAQLAAIETHLLGYTNKPSDLTGVPEKRAAHIIRIGDSRVMFGGKKMKLRQEDIIVLLKHLRMMLSSHHSPDALNEVVASQAQEFLDTLLAGEVPILPSMTAAGPESAFGQVEVW